MKGTQCSRGGIVSNFRAENGAARHGPQVTQALAALRRPEHRLAVVDFALPYRNRVISFIGIEDRDLQRNLGDYQNIGYFLITENPPPKAEHSPNAGAEDVAEKNGEAGEGMEVVVIDPGLREGDWIKAVLGIKKCDVIFSHFHLDHWIGYEPYSGESFFASPLCKTVLTQMVGVERTGKSIFAEGRLTAYHYSPLPLRAANDAERLLPLKERIYTVTGKRTYHNEALALEFFELPYGQTEGTLYGILETGETKIVFGSDLFININDELKIEPHYAFKPKRKVIEDIIVVLRALLGKDLQVPADPTTLTHLKKIACPDKIALGHGLLDFPTNRDKIAHLLAELEELIRINKEHII